jgi:hypothetical protein
MACEGQRGSKKSFCSTEREVRDKTDGVKGETRNKRKNPQITKAEVPEICFGML